MFSPMRLTSLLLAGLSALAGAAIIPQPVAVNPIMDAPATILTGAKVEAPAAFAAEAQLIREAFKGPSNGTTIRLVQVAAPVGNFETGDEGYVIDATPGKPVVVSARTAAGAFYAFQTLKQAVYVGNDGKTYLAPGTILDKPRFKWRGLMLDEGRHFYGKEHVKRFLDLMALHKFNTFHWHLTEDQGWRVEIKKYPKLTQVGAWRDESPVMGDRNKGDGKRYGGFYTQDELREVVAYAAKLHIQVVPEIEMPGHAGAAITAYPEFGNTDIKGYAPKVNTRWGVQYYIFAPKEETFRFIDDIFAELCPIFPSVYFNIGGDEAPKNQWDGSAFAKEVMKREGLANSHELQSYFIKRVEKLLAARGKKLIGWDEIQEGGLSKSATMMVWRDWKWAHHAVNNGNDIVMAPTSHTYFDYGQGPTPKGVQYEVIGGNLPIDKVYSLDPVPKDFTPEQAKRVLGCQAQLWTEYGFNWSKVEYLAFPRACALAEVVWSPQANRNWDNFKGRLDTHLKRLDALKVNYRRADGTPAVTDKMGREDK